jgi:7,8-dihydroneopterin aldolase/epimerase/oxygenase
MPDDTIHLEQLWISACVGVPDLERASPQQLALNITLWPNQPLLDLRDDIARTVNYSAVARAIRDYVREHPVKLIETLAENIAQELLAEFPLRKVQIELRKFVLRDASYVSVTLLRERPTS